MNVHEKKLKKSNKTTTRSNGGLSAARWREIHGGDGGDVMPIHEILGLQSEADFEAIQKMVIQFFRSDKCKYSSHILEFAQVDKIPKNPEQVAFIFCAAGLMVKLGMMRDIRATYGQEGVKKVCGDD